MAYKISRGRPKKIPQNYYEDIEIKELRDEYKGKPPISEVMRVGTRRTLKVGTQIHKKGKVVSYNDKLAIVRKVTKNGLILEPFKIGKDEIAIPSGKRIFLTNEEAEHKVYPNFFANLSLGTVAPYNMAVMED